MIDLIIIIGEEVEVDHNKFLIKVKVIKTQTTPLTVTIIDNGTKTAVMIGL